MALESSSRSAAHQTSTHKLTDVPDTYDIQPLELSNLDPCGFVVGAGNSNKDESSIHRASFHGSHNDHDNDHEQQSEQPPTDTTNIVDSFPDGGTRSWLVVFGSFFLLMASYGMMNSVGVFQSYLETNQLSTYNSTDVGWIPSVFVFGTLFLGVYIGPLFDSHGPKMLVYAGSAVLMLSLFLFAECTQYWQFLLCFGVLGGIGAALVSTVAMACVPHWFQVRAGMAIGTALAGSGLGGVVFPLVLRAGFSNIGFKWTMRVLAFVVGFLCFLGSFMVRSRLPRAKTTKVVIDLRCFKDLKFTWMTFSTFCTPSSLLQASKMN
jgi:MFS family permease